MNSIESEKLQQMNTQNGGYRLKQAVKDMINYGSPILVQFPRIEKYGLAKRIRETMYDMLHLCNVIQKKYYKRDTLREFDAFRTAAHNKNVKGATYSQHCYGKAADIRVQGVSVEEVADYAETLLKGTGGIGRYPVKKGRPAGWVHVDVREVKSRWVM